MSPPRLMLPNRVWISRAVDLTAEPEPPASRRVSDGSHTVRAMLVFSNRRLGPAAELLVSPEIGTSILRAASEAARPLAQSRWEHELVVWLDDRSRRLGGELDVSDIAWSPENFERQRGFLRDAIERAALGSPNARALTLWARQVADHPRESIVVGKRWQWTGVTANL